MDGEVPDYRDIEPVQNTFMDGEVPDYRDIRDFKIGYTLSTCFIAS